ncbi:hypothetical protein SUGI_0430200 [Cryptomeria japonica]|uniref:probable carboxylesterase 15 n=1 Tax=Cryptomeria japonica TaxID=3369 RepID=UPI002408B079|nr:probable carboxylesterase 15 [Cryptomeria japonica]GLJ22823.1 hypothetical protein SUGI_0430200 [Cryptomeria japonica]
MFDKAEPWLVEDNGGPIKLYSDGSVVRAPNPFESLFLTEHNNYGHVPYKDIVFDEETGLWARLYLSPETKNRLPIVMYFHGGGFCMLSAASTLYHRMCQMWAAKLGVIIVSVDYRLAPEHRLPAAYDDSIAALRWMEREGAAKDPWLVSQADFSKIFLAGDSAGGNIAHHVGVWAASKTVEMKIKIKGLILLYPFFGGEDRTPSETEKGSSMLTAEGLDSMWRLALPVGCHRDHPYSNPLAEGETLCSLDLPPVLCAIGGRDILRDKELEYCEALKKWGKRIEVHNFAEEDHGFTVMKMEGQSSLQVLGRIADFIK